MKLASLELKNPLMNAAGICSTLPMLKKWEEAGVGALVTKSITKEECSGGSGVKVTIPYKGVVLNCMKNPNPGYDEFSRERKNYEFDVPLIVQIMGKDEKDFGFLERKLEDDSDGFEINVSCPHSDKGGYRIGFKPDLLKKVLNESRKSTDKPVFVKLPYYGTDYEKLEDVVRVIEEEKIDGITSMNTVGAMDYSPELGRFIKGGQSGHSIHHLALFQVDNIRKLTDLPIIASGGIEKPYDIERFKGLGANAYQLGSGLANYNMSVERFVKKILDGL
jgi:dihydroorotate dehydrogenase subfamily 1